MYNIAKTILFILLTALIFSCQKKKTEIDASPPLSEETAKTALDLKLKDFTPVSAYKLPHTKVDKASYPVIDLHAHPYAKSQEQLEQWVQTMDEVGIDKTVVLTYATGAGFDSLYRVYNQYSDRFILFCGFDYTGYDEPGFGPAAVAELERCVKNGARGVGELGDKGKGLFYCNPTPAYGMHIDDPRMDPLIEKCGELGIPISIHVAEPIWMYLKMDSLNDGLMNAYKWRLDDQPDILDHGEMVGTLENAVKKHPGTTFIACHYANCSYDLNILGNLFDRYSNLYADIGARYAETAPIPRFVNKFFERYQDRLVYGTDMGLNKSMYQVTFRILESEDEHFYAHELFSYHWALHGYGLAPQVLEKVYRQNALRILGME